jgi:ABC-type transport system involved in Fe-S cluster assembly fused permease/ATPase subunit
MKLRKQNLNEDYRICKYYGIFVSNFKIKNRSEAVEFNSDSKLSSTKMFIEFELNYFKENFIEICYYEYYHEHLGVYDKSNIYPSLISNILCIYTANMKIILFPKNQTLSDYLM